jgi:PAS domain S-box-containing protein
MGTVLFLLFTWLAMRRLMLPLAAMTRHMQHLPEKPHHEHQIEIDSADEIGVLATAFNAMIESLDRQQKELRDQKQRIDDERALLDTLINAVPDMIFFKDPNGIYRRCNEACAATAMGLPMDMVMGRSDYDLFPPETAAQFLQRDRETMDSDRPNRYEELICLQPGREMFLETIKVPIRDAKGACEGIIGISRDISDRKRMEEMLQEREAMLRVAMDSIPFDLYAIDRSGRYCMQSLVSMGLWGDIIGRRPEEVLSDSLSRDRWLENRGLAISGKTVQREVECRINNARRYLLEIVTPIRTDGGDIFGILGITIDQTERKLAEAERQRLEEQLIQSQKMESIGRLAGGLAHDLNNLLTPIIGYSELLKRDLPGNEAGLAKTGNILKAAHKAKELVQQLLSFSRKRVLEMKIIDLNQILTGFQGILRHTIRENIDIRFRLVTEQYSIRADRNQIEQIIMNLAVNAQDAIGERGVITVETSPVLLDDEYASRHSEVRAGRYLMLSISDDGCGMDHETRQHIF